MPSDDKPKREFRPRTRRWMAAAVIGMVLGFAFTLLAAGERLDIAGRSLWQDLMARPLILVAGIGWLVFLVALLPAIYCLWRDLRDWML